MGRDLERSLVAPSHSPAMSAAAPADERACTCGLTIGHTRSCAAFDESTMRAEPLARAAASPAEAELPHWFELFLTNVCEIPDRNSPEGEPDAIVATLDELRNCALNAIEQCISYAAPARPRKVYAHGKPTTAT
ncbi:TPA: hypothetical protein RJR38_002721 [Burkholderia multivorans]|nr:hypothetical protein [Burkholderia multivorans]